MPDTNLITNPDNDNYCKCACKINWIDVAKESVTFGKERQYSTHLKCDNCHHFVFLANSKQILLQTEIQTLPEKFDRALTALNHIKAYIDVCRKSSISFDVNDITLIEKYVNKGLGEK